MFPPVFYIERKSDMSLIITLILLAGIAIIYIHDNGGISFGATGPTPEQESQMGIQRFHQMLRAYSFDHDTEHELRYFFPRSEEYTKIEERIKNEAGIKPSTDMVVMGVAAQKCKIPEKYIFLNNGIATAYRSYKQQESLVTERKFFVWYDKELRAHGFPYVLMFAPEVRLGHYHKSGMSVSEAQIIAIQQISKTRNKI